MVTETYEEVESLDDESLESVFGTEARWEESDEERSMPRYRPGPVKLPLQRTPFRPVGGVSGANIQTPAGRAQVQFGKPVATQEAVNNLARQLKGEIASLSTSIKKVNETLDKNTAVLDKKINTVSTTLKSTGQQSQMMTMLPLLMSKRPEMTHIKLGTGALQEVTDQKYAPDDMLPLLLVMMMSGTGTQGTDSNNSMTMMMMMMALSGSFGKK